jgi:hypothetical protein
MKLGGRKLLFKLILIGLLAGGAAGCHRSEDVGLSAPDVDADTDSDSDSDTVPDSDSDTVPDTDSDTATESDPWEEECYDVCDWYCYDYPVESAIGGTPAELDQVCDAADEPVQSPAAAKVTFNAYSALPHLATGAIYIPDDLRANLVGDPSLEVIECDPPDLAMLQVSDLAASETGFTFNAEWPDTFLGWGWMWVRVSFSVACEELDGGTSDGGLDDDAGPETDGGTATKLVEALTHVEWCYQNNWAETQNWTSSGDTCFDCWEECYDTCEMAPSPIRPAVADDDRLGLPSAFRVALVPVWKNGRAVSVIAEHDGARGPVSYEWHASAGRLSDEDQGGVVWSLPQGPGPHLIQVAVRDRDSAAVASLSWRLPA